MMTKGIRRGNKHSSASRPAQKLIIPTENILSWRSVSDWILLTTNDKMEKNRRHRAIDQLKRKRVFH